MRKGLWYGPANLNYKMFENVQNIQQVMNFRKIELAAGG